MSKVSEINAENVFLCSDLHLNPNNKMITTSFCNLLKRVCFSCRPADKPDWILILGDFFEHWVGDDLISTTNHYDYKNIIEMLKECFNEIHKLKISVGIMHGNRDFLIGSKLLNHFYACQLASSVRLTSKFKGNILLLHGDELCTQDTQHQEFRKLVNSLEWQSKFKSLPIDERMSIANSIRSKSEGEKKDKSLEMMDIDPQTADKFLQETNSEILIHGHTHLPGRNLLPSGKERWVIPNWTVDSLGNVCGGGIQIKNDKIVQISN